MATALAHAGADVVLAASAQDALGLLDRVRPDVIISDIGMPGEDGYTFLEALKERGNGRFRDVPVIAVTAYARETDRTNVLAAGFRTHLPKPVDLDELVRLVEDVTTNPTGTHPPSVLTRDALAAWPPGDRWTALFPQHPMLAPAMHL